MIRGVTTLIEISGGVLVGIYSDVLNEDVLLLDWDDYRADEENYAPALVGSMSLDQMPEETKILFDK